MISPAVSNLPSRGPSPLSRRTLLLGAGAAAASFAMAPALRAAAPQESIAATVEALRPGEFLWAPEAAPAGPIIIIVSISKQRAYVYRNGVLIGISTASTGTAGHETPTGIFTILQKDIDHKSNLYDDAPMPFMQRLTWGGIALHAGNLPGYPASHGCIRLPLAFARQLYGVTRLGLTVIITGSPDIPHFAPAPRVLEKSAPRSSFDGAFAILWEPEKSPTGPVSIILSGADQRAVVLRNGVEIGSAPITIEGSVPGLQAFTLASIDGRGPHWMFLPLLGNTRVGEVTQADRDRVTLPEGFRASIRSILVPGSTLIVTADTLLSGNSGAPLTVIEGEDEQ